MTTNERKEFIELIERDKSTSYVPTVTLPLKQYNEMREKITFQTAKIKEFREFINTCDEANLTIARQGTFFLKVDDYKVINPDDGTVMLMEEIDSLREQKSAVFERLRMEESKVERKRRNEKIYLFVLVTFVAASIIVWFLG